jgi:hypothetical protein
VRFSRDELDRRRTVSPAHEAKRGVFALALAVISQSDQCDLLDRSGGECAQECAGLASQVARDAGAAILTPRLLAEIDCGVEFIAPPRFYSYWVRY